MGKFWAILATEDNLSRGNIGDTHLVQGVEVVVQLGRVGVELGGVLLVQVHLVLLAGLLLVLVHLLGRLLLLEVLLLLLVLLVGGHGGGQRDRHGRLGGRVLVAAAAARLLQAPRGQTARLAAQTAAPAQTVHG